MATTAKYDIPLTHLDYGYVLKCTDVKELEKIIKVLRSGDEGRYPDLEDTAEKRLAELNPNSKVLRKDQPILNTTQLPKADQKNIFEDIDGWTNDIKSVESNISQNGVTNDDSLPPVRGKANISIGQNKKTGSTNDKTSNKRVKPRDYREWDKIDVEAELDKVDQEEPKSASKSGGGLRSVPNIPETVPLAGLTDDEKNLKAEKEKEKGNEAFRSGDYQEAVLYYSRSLSLNCNIAARNNRAQAYLKLEKWDKAITDVENVLALEENNVKAYLRRGVAYQGKRKFIEAKSDIEKVLELEPNNKRAKTVLVEIETALKEQKVKGRRMVIEETDGSDEEEEEKIEEIIIGGNKNIQEKVSQSKIEEVTTPKIQEINTPQVENESKSKDKKAKEVQKHSNKKQKNKNKGRNKGSSQQDTTKSKVEDGVKVQKTDTQKTEQNITSSSINDDKNESVKSETKITEVTGDKSETKMETAAPVVEPPPPLPKDIIKLKETGNELFKTGRYAEAITKYTNAINKLENDHRHVSSLTVLYSNRAGCKHKTGDCSGCIEDCNIALSLTPGSVKPLLRRATAYETLEKYRHAYVDFKQILLIDSKADIAQQGVNRCQAILSEMDGRKWREKLPQMSPMPTGHMPTFPTSQATKPTPVTTKQAPAVKKPSASGEPMDTMDKKGGNNMSDAEKLKLYNSEKDKGNNFVKKGEFQSAIQCYTTCIQLCPDQSVAYNNRALCYLRTDKPSNALSDCDKALEREPDNVKALFRKAQAYKMLKQYSESKEYLEKVLSLDKNNAAAKREMHVVQKYVMEEKEKKKTAPRKKITIQEVSSDEESDAENTAPVKSSPQQQSISKEEQSSESSSSSVQKQPSDVSSSQHTSSPQKVTVINEDPSKDNKHKSSSNTTNTSEVRVTEKDLRSSNKKDCDSDKNIKTKDIESGKFVDYEKKAAKSSSKIRPTAGLMGNNTALKLDRATPFEFVSAWTALKTSHDINQYLALLEQVEPEKLPTVISNKLEGNMLYTIIKCTSSLAEQGKSRAAYGYLNHLTAVPRFEMNTMFMSGQEKKELKSVLDKLKKSTDSAYTPADLDKLAKKYGL